MTLWDCLQLWIIGASLMTLVWLLVLTFKIPSIIDAYWSVGIAILSTVLTLEYPLIHPTFQFIQLSLVWIWALRLCGHLLWTRVWKRHQDPRYLALQTKWKSQKWGYFKNMQIQALMQVGVSTVFWASASPRPALEIICTLGILVALGGLTLEWVADWQLLQFKKLGIKERVCDHGLWTISRHPNYLGEWLFWIGLGLVGWGISHNLWTWISPILMYCILVHITGPLTEAQSLRSRPEAFKAYQNVTPYFIPSLHKIWSNLRSQKKES